MFSSKGLDREYLSSINIGTHTLYKEISKQYNDNDILAYVNHVIPHNVLMQSNSYNNHENQSFKAILHWFKTEFMKWMPKDLQCNICNIQMKLKLLPGDSWKLRSTEIYECMKCGSKCVFPRYGEIKKIADTRIGRCSEWSMLFGAILNSLSIPTRIVHDYLDHCWNESYIGQKWIHIDSTLAYPISFNHPHYYEQNWNKKYEYIIAFSANSIEDVTRRYTEKWDSEVLTRRTENKTDRKIDAFTKIYSRL
jgi:peptide-N4-(N-acetyl-beta-glucosaminyl)asparagine amidase